MTKRLARALKARDAFIDAIIERGDAESAEYWLAYNFRFQHGTNPAPSDRLVKARATVDVTRDAWRKAYDKLTKAKG